MSVVHPGREYFYSRSDFAAFSVTSPDSELNRQGPAGSSSRRLMSCREGASMTPDDVRAAAERLVQFHERLAPLFGKDPAQDRAYDDLKGLIGSLLDWGKLGRSGPTKGMAENLIVEWPSKAGDSRPFWPVSRHGRRPE
jgi:hypothetical protein